MRQGQGTRIRRPERSRPPTGDRTAGRVRPGRRVAGTAAVAAVVVIGLGATAVQGSASAAPVRRPPVTAPTTSTTTVVTPTTTVTTTTRPRSTTTSTTTVATGPGTETSTTTTTVSPTTTSTSTPTTTPTRTPTAGRTSPRSTTTTTTTTTTVPTSTTTTVPTTTTTTTTTVPPPGDAPPPGIAPAAFDSTCSVPATPGLQTYLDSLPAGSTFTSSSTACYLVPVGILVEHPITIVGGTFYDPTTERQPGSVHDPLKPIILIKDTADVTVRDVSVLGANTAGVYHAQLVGEAGVKVESSLDVTLAGITARNTFGDGLELVADLTNHIRTPVTGLTVDGYTTDNAGRQGVTLAEVASSVLDGVNVVSPADSGFDFESDLPGLGSGDVTISNCTDDHGFNLIEYFTGPITVNDCTGFHHVSLGSPNSEAPIRFSGGTLTCKRHDPQPCIRQNGGSLTFTGVAIDRMPGTIGIKEPVWDVEGGGSLSFVDSPIQSPMGTATAPARVRFLG